MGRADSAAQNQSRLLKPVIADVALAAVLVALPVLALVRTAGRPTGPDAAYVYQSGRLKAVLPLDRNREFVVESGKHRLLLEVSGGGVSVRESNCPKGICRHAGRIDRPGRPIVCIPSRVVIEIRGRGAEYDAESY